jgi:hypothetical protein
MASRSSVPQWLGAVEPLELFPLWGVMGTATKSKKVRIVFIVRLLRNRWCLDLARGCACFILDG